LVRAAAPLTGTPLSPPTPWTWCSPRRVNFERGRIFAQLKAVPGNHLVIVRYGPEHDIWYNEWVYNEADIDHAKVVWARDMGPVKNKELIEYFRDRHVWLVEADETPPRVLPNGASP